MTNEQRQKLRETIAKASVLDGTTMEMDAEGIGIERDGLQYAYFPFDCQPMNEEQEAYNKQVKSNAWLFLSCRSLLTELLDEGDTLRDTLEATRRELDSFKGAVDLEFVSALNTIQEERDHYDEYSDRFSKQLLEHVNDIFDRMRDSLSASRETLGTRAFVQQKVAESGHLLRNAEAKAIPATAAAPGGTDG